MKYFLIIFIVWLFFIVVGIGVGMIVFNPSRINHFIEKGVLIYGNVINKDPQQHQHIIFVYEVSGKRYNGIGNAGRGNPEFEQIQIGQKVIVCYDSENPENAILGYPQMYSGADYSGIWFSAIFVSLFPLIITILITAIYIYTKKSKKPVIPLS